MSAIPVPRQPRSPRRLTPQTLCRLSRGVSHSGATQGHVVDTERYFLCPSLTPLWYAPAYGQLAEADRRLYNQLTALMNIEAISWFEATFLPALDSARRNLRDDDEGRDLAEAIKRFAEDERNHIQWWDSLRADSLDAIGLPHETRLLKINPLSQRVMSGLARGARHFTAMFWVMLALEEHALEIARRNLNPVAGMIDPSHLSAHRDHLRDEARHVQMDWHLIERFYECQRVGVRRINARFFAWVLERYLLPPVRGAMQVIDCWVGLRPHLASQVGELKQQLRAVTHCPEYRAMMYSRRATPVLFTLMDRHAEMAGLAERLDGMPVRKLVMGGMS